MKRDSTLSTIGLAMRAGKVVSGEFMTEGAVKSQKACLVIIARDVSDNTRKKSEICVNFIKYHFVNTQQKMN